MLPINLPAALIAVSLTCSELTGAFVSKSSLAFAPRQAFQGNAPSSSSSLFLAEGRLSRVDEEEEGTPIPFLDTVGNFFIECYADSVAKVEGTDYTIGVPCDYCVALCYFEEDNNLVPVELDDKLMDDIFPIAENIVSEEFGDELSLQRTPQTLTLVGELEDDLEDELDDEDEDDEDSPYEGEEEVEVLLSFEHRGTEFNLVRLLEPVLLVGKTDPERPDMRVLLNPEESDRVMPALEEMFIKFHEDDNDMLP